MLWPDNKYPTDVTEGCADKGKEDNQDRFLQVQDNLLQWFESLSDLPVTRAVSPESDSEELQLIVQAFSPTKG
jgi:hypothetical protein